MRLKEFIEECQKIYEQHGDLKVVRGDYDDGEVHFYPHHDLPAAGHHYNWLSMKFEDEVNDEEINAVCI